MSDNVSLQITTAGAPGAAPQRPEVKALDRLIADKGRRVTFTDRYGRAITIKKVPLSRRLSLSSLIGPDASTEYRLSTIAAAAVEMINGEPTGAVTTRNTLDVMLDRLDDGGIEDVYLRYVEEFFAPPLDAKEKAAALGEG